MHHTVHTIDPRRAERQLAMDTLLQSFFVQLIVLSLPAEATIQTQNLTLDGNGGNHGDDNELFDDDVTKL